MENSTMEIIFKKLNDIFYELNFKLDETINIMDNISSFIIDYSKKVPLTESSDVYLIFHLRASIALLYKDVAKCVSNLRKKMSQDTLKVKNYHTKLSSSRSHESLSLDKLKIMKRLNEKYTEWSGVLEKLKLNFVCKTNYILATKSIMDSIESLTNTKEDYDTLTASNFINQKVLYNGDSIEKVVEKILNLSKDKIKNEQENTFITKLMDSLNAQLFIEKYNTEMKLNEMLTILSQNKNQSVISSELISLFNGIQEKLSNLEQNIEKIKIKPIDIMKSIDEKNLVLKKSFGEAISSNTKMYMTELKNHISELKSSNSNILAKLDNKSDTDDISKIDNLEAIISKMTKELPTILINNVKDILVNQVAGIEQEFVDELTNIRRKLQLVEKISKNLEQYNTNNTETKLNMDSIMSELNDYIKALTDAKSIIQAIVTGVYGELFNTISNLVSEQFKNITNDQSIDLQYAFMKYITGDGKLSDETLNLKDTLINIGYGADPKKLDDVILHFKDLRNNLNLLVNKNKLSLIDTTKKLETILNDISRASKHISRVSNEINPPIEFKKKRKLESDVNYPQRSVRPKLILKKTEE